jgi:hypothetical protein
VSDPTEKEKHAEKVKQAIIDIVLRKDNDYLCKNYILNVLGDDLYGKHCKKSTMQTSKKKSTMLKKLEPKSTL